MEMLQSQSQLLSQMTTSLQEAEKSVKSIHEKIVTQADIVKSLSDKFVKGKDELKSINTSLESLIKESEKLKKIDVKKLKKILNFTPIDTKNTTTNVVNSLDSHTDTLNDIAQQNNAEMKLGLAQAKELDQAASDAEKASNQTVAACSELGKSMTISTDKVKAGTSSLPSEEEIKKASGESSGSSFSFSGFWPIAIIKSIYTLTKIAFNVMSTAIQVYVGLMKTLFTLPFSIARQAVEVGNELREEIFVKIGNKVEEFKDDFSLSSRIGKDIVRLGVLAEEAMLESKDTQSLFAKTFDKENYTGALDSVKQTLQGLGSLAEYIGPTITKSNDTVIYMERMQRSLGIGIEELKYYSIDAINSLKGLPEVLHANAMAIESVRKKQNVDFKFLSKAFHTLRKNIVEFGHLSATELAEVSAKLIKMKISADDVVGIFGKVSSFEQASNMSAQLFQSFGMVLDAYDMLSANDPMEIIMQLRDGMLNAGKSFETLNRHEKALLKSTTGLSDHALKSVFSYADLGKSQEEIANSMEAKNPTELMTDGLQQMTSVIRTIKRTLTFKNPFQAIFRGLMENTVASKELIVSSKKLSEAYEVLQRSLMTIDDKTIEGFTVPLNIILRRFNRIITDGSLGDLFGKGIATVSDFFQDLYVQATDSRVDDIINDATHMLKMLENAKDEKLQAQYVLYEGRFVDLIDEFNHDMPEQFKKIASDLGLLDKNGNLNPNLTLENMSQIMLSALQSEDVSVAKYAEDNFSNRINFIEELKGQLKLISSGDSALKIKLEEVISYKGGVEGTLDRLYKGLESMLDEGTKLFTGIFRLGQSLMAGLFRGLIIGSTGLILLLNGNIDKASDLLGKHIEGLGGDNAILNFLKIDKKEFKLLTGDLELAAAKFGDKSGDKLLPAFGFILTKLYESAGDLLDVMRPLVDNIVGTIYDTLDSGNLKQKAAALGIKSITGHSVERYQARKVKEKVKNESFSFNDIQALLNITASDEGYNVGRYYYDTPATKIIDRLSEQYKDNTYLDNSFGLGAKMSDAYNVYSFYLENIDFLRSLIESRDLLQTIYVHNPSDMKRTILKLIDTHKVKPIIFNPQDNNKVYTQKRDDMLNFTRSFNRYMGNLKFRSEPARSANDIVKLHHNDEVEVIASKQGGMLKTLASSIKERFKENVNVAKTTLKMTMLNRNEEDYESDEDLIQQITTKLESYVDFVSSRKIKIIQNNLEILEQ